MTTTETQESRPEDAPIKYIRDFLTREDADKTFTSLEKETPWERRVSRMRGRDVPVPRLEVWIAEKPYTYSGRTYQPHPWTPLLSEIKEKVERAARSEFNSVLLNLYGDGRDSVGWHADNEPEMSHDHPIASVSLGATRRFQVRKGKDGPIQPLELGHGSLLIMGAGMQREWRHQLKKEPKPCGPRINLTFRWMIF